MKRILMYRWKAYNYLDIKQYFESHGFEVTEIVQELESYDADPAFTKRIEKILSRQSFEFVFTVNYFALLARVCFEKNILYVSWTCDNPLISMHHESVFYPTNCIFSFDKANVLEFKQLGVEHIYHLPLAVDAARNDAIIENASDLSVYENEVCFVGSLYERNSYDRIEPEFTDYLRGYFEALIKVQSDLYGSNIIEDALTLDILAELQEHFTLEKSDESFSDLGLIFSTTTLGFKIAQKTRVDSLNALSKRYPVSIYSNSDTSVLPRVVYKGSLEYWTQMPKVFRGSKINLNFTIPNIKSGIPLRVFDVLGAGGFLLTNYQAELPLYFEEGEDLVMFYGLADLEEKVGFYMAHDTLREKIAENGHQKVKKYHSYETRMDTMLKIIREHF